MLSFAANVRLYLCTMPTDMRKSFNGLYGIVKSQLFVIWTPSTLSHGPYSLSASSGLSVTLLKPTFSYARMARTLLADG